MWLSLMLGLLGGGILGGAMGSTLGGGGDVGNLFGLDLFGKTYEGSAPEPKNDAFSGLLGAGAGIGGIALLLMVMSMNSQRNQQAQQPLVVVIDDDD